MRRLLCLLLPVALLVGGCGSDEPEEASGDLGAVTVTPAEGGAGPTLEVPEPFSVTDSDSRVITPGTGEPVAEGDVVGMQYVLVNGSSGEELARSDWSGSTTSLVVDDAILTGLRTGLVGQNEGSEVLVAVAPQDGLADATAPTQAGVSPEDTLLFYVQVVSAVPPRAEGTPVPPQPGLPAVTLGPDGAPTITIPPGSAPPTELVVQPLIEGTGEPVQAGQTVQAHYTGVKYADGSVFDSSWERGTPAPFVIGEGQVIDGWDIGLVNQPVGSQVLLIVPPAQGYKEAGQPDAGITGTDTLVFVVDILAAG